MSQEAPRPGQATLAGWLIIGGSVVLVATAWQRISTLHTLEVQEQLRQVLAEPALDGVGMSVSTLSEIIRILCMVAAGAATASAILGWHALRRSSSARLALTLLAPLVAVGGMATAGFFAPMVVAGVVMLWLRPTRDWFAGRPWVSARSAAAARSDQRTPRPDPFATPPVPNDPPVPSEPPTPSDPPPHPVPSERPTAPPAWQGSFGQPLPDERPEVAPAQAAAAVGSKRPGRLVAACVIVWVSTFCVAGSMALTALVLVVVPDQLFAEVERQGMSLQGMSRGEVTTAALLMAGLSIVWSIAAAVFALLAFKRVAWARVALVVSSAAAGLLMLVLVLGAPYLVVLVAAAAVTCAFLLRPEVAGWFKR